MKTLNNFFTTRSFELTERQANLMAIIGTTLIAAAVVYALIAGDISGFNNTYLSN